MTEILPEIARWQAQREQIAIATLLHVRGSAPRLPGARLGITRSGKMAGSVSGGCVENDLFQRAMCVLEAGVPEVATYGIDDESAFAVGLSCGGAIEVLIEPFAGCPAWQAVVSGLERREAVALAVGIAPALLLGRKFALTADGSTAGGIDPALDAAVAEEARRLLRTGGARVLTVPFHGADARIFVEGIPPPLRLFVVGATHVASVLCRLAKPLGFHVTVIDARGIYATRDRFHDADALVRGQPAEILEAAGLDESSYVVTLTHDPKFDLPVLACALRSPARYVGAMGSMRTHARRVAALREQGLSEAEAARIRAPVGLDLGGRTPEEMALAIMAEILAVRYGRDARPLAERRAAAPAEVAQ